MPTTEKTNKINYGLKNLYYALITETVTETGVTVAYATPVRMPGGSSVNLSALVEKVAIAADDDPEYATAYDNKGYEGDVVLYDVPDSFFTDCLGFKVENNTVVEDADAKPAPFAFLFEFDGDATKTRHVLYRCTATKPAVTSTTKGNGLTANNATLTLSASKAKDTGHIKRKVKAADGSTVYENWFKSVYVSTGGTE